MPDVQEVFRLATNKVQPDPDALERQVRRQRAEVRRSRVRAYVAVAAVLVLLGVAILALSRVVGRNEPTPEGQTGSQPPTRTFEHTLVAQVTPQRATIVRLNGSKAGEVPDVPVQAYAPSVTSDGSTMAFVDAPTETQFYYNQIAVMGTDGTGARFVPTPGIIVDWVAISPDGSRIAFQGDAGDGLNIYVINVDGSGLRQLTTDPATDQYPQWSPDGKTIVYDNAGKREQDDAQFSKTAEIFTVAADGSEPPTQLTHNRGYDAAPSYSPDGSTIVEESFRGISTMDADGGNPKTIADIGGFTPRYSPNGQTVAFSYFSNRWRPDMQFGANYNPSMALCLLATVDVATGRVNRLSDVAMATDGNTPQWIDNQHILVRSVPARDPATH